MKWLPIYQQMAARMASRQDMAQLVDQLSTTLLEIGECIQLGYRGGEWWVAAYAQLAGRARLDPVDHGDSNQQPMGCCAFVVWFQRVGLADRCVLLGACWPGSCRWARLPKRAQGSFSFLHFASGAGACPGHSADVGISIGHDAAEPGLWSVGLGQSGADLRGLAARRFRVIGRLYLSLLRDSRLDHGQSAADNGNCHAVSSLFNPILALRLGFIVLSNIIGLGFALLLVQIAAVSPWVALVTIVVNAYIGTGLSMALLVFYRSRALKQTPA